jgi:prepilin-type N-terminal cleavage/methylation domain-containing protein
VLTVKRRLRQLHSDQGGFSLPELLVAMVVGMIVLLSAAFLLDNAVSKSNQIADRQEANQRGRLAMERVTRDLRSQVCLKDQRPITIAEDQRVSFYASLSSNPDTADLRTITYSATTKKIVQDIVPGVGTFPDLTFPGPGTQNLLLEGAQPAKDAGVDRPMFRYYGYLATGTAGELQLLQPTPLSAADRQRVVLIEVAFNTLPTRTLAANTTARDSTTFESDVYVRLADPTKPLDGPRCI